jgi:riboflavin synthase
VDGVGEVERVHREGDALLVDVALPAEIAELLVPYGSITVDGVSLTVNAIPAPRIVQLSLIEYTLRHTTLGALVPGDLVHVEGDVIGKYVRRLLEPYRHALHAGPNAGGNAIPDSRFPTL